MTYAQMRRIAYMLLAAAMLLSCTPAHRKELLSIPYDSLRNGDIVFRSGLSLSSNMIMMHDGSGKAYSHIGIVCRSDSGWCIVHAVNDEPDFPGDFDRVKIDRIESFFSPERASAGEIMHSWIDDSTSRIITQRALEYAQDSIPFDSDFNHNCHDAIYCSELIYLLYNSVGIDITEGRRTKVGTLVFPDEIIFPSDIYKNACLKSFFKF